MQFVPLALAVLPAVAGVQFCDVAVIGGGVAGSTAAVLLKDNGYDVCLFEKKGQLGGTCDSVQVDVPEGCTGSEMGPCANYIDVGAGHFVLNTTWQTERGFGQYDFSTEAWIKRFVPEDLLYTVDYAASPGPQSQLTVNLGTKAEVQVPVNNTAVNILRAQFNAILAQWPWLEGAVDYPDPLPSQLLTTVKDFLIQNKLTELAWPVFGPSIAGGGSGSLDRVSMFYAALRNRRGSGAASATGSKGGLMINGGCRPLYQGIEQFLGDAVLYNAEVMNVWRPHLETPYIQVLARSNGIVKQYFAKKLVIAIPPTTTNLKFLQYPDLQETRLYAKVKSHFYASALVTLEGPKVNGTAYTIRSADPTHWASIPATPVVMRVVRGLTYGPAVAFYVTDKEEGEVRDYTKIQQDLNSLPTTVATKASVTYVDPYEYKPHFSLADLKKSPTPYTQWKALQGYRRTYYVGALFSAAELVKIWEHTYDLIQQYFPPQ